MRKPNGQRKRIKKSKAKGEILIRIRKNIEVKSEKRKRKKEGIILKKVKNNRRLYVSERVEKKLDELKEWMERKKEKIRTILGEDFNARTGELGGEVREKDKKEEKK